MVLGDTDVDIVMVPSMSFPRLLNCFDFSFFVNRPRISADLGQDLLQYLPNHLCYLNVPFIRETVASRGDGKNGRVASLLNAGNFGRKQPMEIV